jgi:hypothetical protein
MKVLRFIEKDQPEVIKKIAGAVDHEKTPANKTHKDSQSDDLSERGAFYG